MPRVLLTAFRPFDQWGENASWLALQALTRDLPAGVEVVTRLYPVDYTEVRSRLASDLVAGYDAVLHVGQAAGSAGVRLEQFALNACRGRGDGPNDVRQLEPDGPAAYRSRMPLCEWAPRLRESGVPAEVSLHAGDYLCNAAFYWSHYLGALAGRPPRAALVHLPLDVSQAAALERPQPSLSSELAAYGLRQLVAWAIEPDAAESTVAEAAPPRGTGA